jgi:protein-glucosylgalactosylhydroxylysine glucosidase
MDMISIFIRSSLISRERIRFIITFPYGSPGITAADWEHDNCHATEILGVHRSRRDLKRILDHDTYSHTEKACRRYWNTYRGRGGVIAVHRSKDPRAPELERRIILSQYLTAIQCSGSLPPQETGLTCNSWYGKFHLEMHWWHSVHFVLWEREFLLERSLQWYFSILPSAKETASSQGYAGARWPKMTSPDGAESPSPINPSSYGSSRILSIMQNYSTGPGRERKPWKSINPWYMRPQRSWLLFCRMMISAGTLFLVPPLSLPRRITIQLIPVIPGLNWNTGSLG